MPFGFADDKWEQAKAQAKEIIVARAMLRGMIPYSEMLAGVSAIELEPGDHRLSPFLEEISLAEAKANRPMLTAIVVHKSGDMQPGPGFFELAERLGRDTSDLLRCWIEEAKLVHAFWEKQKKRAG